MMGQPQTIAEHILKPVQDVTCTILMLILVAVFFLDDHDPIYHPYDNFDVDAGGWFLTLKVVCR